ncbi:hypothetical protein GCM10011612_14270 [Actinomyces gaoshouyii]|uniref:Uncharacterized protein n=1 Tax=Actinomyces gaoshouyii TaxID=1960083 RepID=A0A8H9LGA8_9ACTO|nr:hypothetical protein GCM10011612_14270 [Actinomyces gaoshouyii]
MSTAESRAALSPTRTPGTDMPTSWEDAEWDDAAPAEAPRILGIPISLDPRGLRERAARHYSPTAPPSSCRAPGASAGTSISGPSRQGRAGPTRMTWAMTCAWARRA